MLSWPAWSGEARWPGAPERGLTLGRTKSLNRPRIQELRNTTTLTGRTRLAAAPTTSGSSVASNLAVGSSTGRLRACCCASLFCCLPAAPFAGLVPYSGSFQPRPTSCQNHLRAAPCWRLRPIIDGEPMYRCEMRIRGSPARRKLSYLM